ncbi:MAG: phage portal protein [Aerococcus sp.]|nr:phage portal protein [Aerococcus sp.]
MDIKNFLMENVKPAKDTKDIHFDRFQSPFVIQSITERENTALRRKFTNKRFSKSGNRVVDVDYDRYQDALVARCVKVPDLANAELQASYGTEGSEIDTLKAMLMTGEYADLTEEIVAFNGFDSDHENELIDEVKK